MKTVIKGIEIAGIAAAVPETWQSLEEQFAGISKEKQKMVKKFRKSTGVKGRYLCGNRQTASDLCTAAAEKLLTAAERQITLKRRSFEKLGASLDAMSPLRVLSRGYSIAEDEAGRPLRSVEELRPGGRVSLLMSDGQADCVVEDIRQGDGIWHPKN